MESRSGQDPPGPSGRVLPAVRRSISSVDEFATGQSLPGSLLAVLTEFAQDERSNSESLARAIEKDIDLAERVLHTASSPLYMGYERRSGRGPAGTSGLPQAISRLGRLEVLRIAFHQGLYTMAGPGDPLSQVLVAHMLVTGEIARGLGREQGRSVADQAYFAGLVHDFGKLLLWRTLPDQYRQVMAHSRMKGTALVLAERAVLPRWQEIFTDHVKTGAELLRAHSIQEDIVAAVQNHHDDLADHIHGWKDWTLSGLVIAADHLAYACGIGDGWTTREGVDPALGHMLDASPDVLRAITHHAVRRAAAAVAAAGRNVTADSVARIQSAYRELALGSSPDPDPDGPDHRVLAAIMTIIDQTQRFEAVTVADLCTLAGLGPERLDRLVRDMVDRGYLRWARDDGGAAAVRATDQLLQKEEKEILREWQGRVAGRGRAGSSTNTATTDLPPGISPVWTTPAHEDTIFDLAWSPDGLALATACRDGRVRVWDIGSRQLTARSCAAGAPVTSLAWSPEGADIAAGTLGATVQICHAASGESSRTFENLGDRVWAVGWSPEGRRVSAGTATGDIELLDRRSRESATRKSLVGHAAAVRSLAWGPDHGRLLASGALDGTVRLWEPRSRRIRRTLRGHHGGVLCVCWSANGLMLASGSEDATIRVWDPATGLTVQVLAGHAAAVTSVTFSADGRLLASLSRDGTIHLWCTTHWSTLGVIRFAVDRGRHHQLDGGLAFHPREPWLAAVLEDRNAVAIWRMDHAALRREPPPVRETRDVSAKVVLAGDSLAGKSCLALRLSEGRSPQDDRPDSTHGLRFWPVRPEQLDPKTPAVTGEDRGIVLWDLGGQTYYRHIHRLFLADASVALFLFDLDQAPESAQRALLWIRDFQRQLATPATRRFLVGTKLDKVVAKQDRHRIKGMLADAGCKAFHGVSAYTGEGIDDLGRAILQAIDWPALHATTSPRLYGDIRDAVERRRSAGELVVSFGALLAEVEKDHADERLEDQVGTAVRHLAHQGVLADVPLATGERVLVLQIGEIERYAGALIRAAHDNPHRIPVVEESALSAGTLHLPGLEQEGRLAAEPERVVLQAVTRLLIDSGTCFRQDGLLVFPALFEHALLDRAPWLGVDPETRRLAFNGHPDAVYAAVITALVQANLFERFRLGRGAAAFESPDGSSALVTLLGETAVRGVLQVQCARQTQEAIRHTLLAICTDRCESGGMPQVQPGQTAVARAWLPMPAGAAGPAHAPAAFRGSAAEIRILHLSDLHFEEGDDPGEKLEPLLLDLRDRHRGLGVERLDLLVVSGDTCCRARPPEFAVAREFVRRLCRELDVTPARCVLAPGNHDLSWGVGAYDLSPSGDPREAGQPADRCVHHDGRWFVRNEDNYLRRFSDFDRCFYHPVAMRPYPAQFGQQFEVLFYPDLGLQFLVFNSAWQTDEHHPARASVHPQALLACLADATRSVARAEAAGQWDTGTVPLRIAVWHHPLDSLNKTGVGSAHGLLEHLRKAGVRVCLHGHVHEIRAELLRDFRFESLLVAGTGSFGAPATRRPESTSKLYSLLEVSRDLRAVRVHTRRMLRDGDPWEGLHEWSSESPDLKLPFYSVPLESVGSAA